jgi:hypothetical protein
MLTVWPTQALCSKIIVWDQTHQMTKARLASSLALPLLLSWELLFHAPIRLIHTSLFFYEKAPKLCEKIVTIAFCMMAAPFLMIYNPYESSWIARMLII